MQREKCECPANGRKREREKWRLHIQGGSGSAMRFLSYDNSSSCLLIVISRRVYCGRVFPVIS